MTSHNHRMLTLVVPVLLFAPARALPAEPVVGFTARPDRCIALNQGQVCYQTVTFIWQTLEGANYCLYRQMLPEPLVCWSGNRMSTYTLEFVSDSNVVYAIRNEGEATILSEVEVEVAWVYTSNRKSFSRWRLF